MTPEVLQGPTFDARRGVLKLIETFAHRIKHGEKVWNAGLGEVVKAAINESDIPGPMTPVEIARKLGVLGPVRRVRGTR